MDAAGGFSELFALSTAVPRFGRVNGGMAIVEAVAALMLVLAVCIAVALVAAAAMAAMVRLEQVAVPVPVRRPRRPDRPVGGPVRSGGWRPR